MNISQDIKYKFIEILFCRKDVVIINNVLIYIRFKYISTLEKLL